MYNYNLKETLKPEEILVYLRKSRTDDPLLSVDEVLSKHETILDEWVARNLDAPIREENKFREVVSGETIADRPEFQKVLKLIESPRYKAILTVEVQRLSRGDLEDAGRLIKLLRYTDTLVITPTKTFDLKDEYDRDIFERELKRGNEYLEYQKKIMKRGKDLSASQGNFTGSVPPYGYRKVVITEGKRKCPTLAIIEEQAEVVRMIYDMYVNQDLSAYEITKRLDAMHITPPREENWSTQSVRAILKNVHYLGKIKLNERKKITIVEEGEFVKKQTVSKYGDYQVFEGKHEAIISEEIFLAALEKNGKRPKVKDRVKLRNPFAGLLFCKCGYAMVLRIYNAYRRDILCRPRLYCNDTTHCDTGSCLYSDLEEAVINVLKQLVTDCEIMLETDNDEAVKRHDKLIASLEKKLSNLRAKEVAQWEAQADPNVENRMPQHVFQMLNSKLLKEKEEVETALREAYDTMPTPTEYRQRLEKLQNAIDALQDPSVDATEKNLLLKACIDRIEYSRGKPHRRERKEQTDAPKNIETPCEDNGWDSPPIELNIKLKV